MRPISLEMQAFGPYKDKQFIDFESLSRNGLLLICGDTGSGKTMILDAITMVLFGRSSGAGRNDIENLRCNRCDNDTETYIEFVFASKGKIYKFEKRLEKKVKNYSESQNIYFLNEEGSFEPMFEKLKKKDVAQYAQEIIGLDYDQFTQVIVLPQGKFEQFLTSGSEEKEKILAEIFGAQKWGNIAQAFYDRAVTEHKKIADENIRINSVLEQVGCSNLEEYKQIIDDKKQQKAHMEEEYVKADYDKQRKELQMLRDISRSFEIIDENRMKLNLLEEKESDIKQMSEKIEASKRAEQIREPKAQFNMLQKEAERRKEELDAAEQQKAEKEEILKKAEKEYSEHCEDEHFRKESFERKIILEEKRDVYASVESARKAFADAESEWNEAALGLKEEEKKAETSESEMAEALAEWNKARNDHSAAMNAYTAGAAGWLAKELKEGEACPVCGSTHHPEPHSFSENDISREDVERKREMEESKLKLLKKLREEQASKKNEIDELRQSVQSLENAKNVAASEYSAVKDNLIEGIDSLEQLEQQIKTLGEEISKYDEKEMSLRATREKAKEELIAAENKMKIADEENRIVTSDLEKGKKNLADISIEAGFAGIEQAEESLLEREEILRMNETIAEHVASKKNLSEANKKIEAEIGDTARPDIDEIARRQNDIDVVAEEFNREIGSLNNEIEKDEEKYNSIAVGYEGNKQKLVDAESMLKFARSVTGNTGIGLERYVLGIMFDQVIYAANQMLKNVHGGRYTLARTKEKVSKNKRGLDLVVFDSFSKTEDTRPVTYLSGGEKFLVSLALSIGISTMARTDGINIEAMFIDEGFGSLDDSSIGDALEVLNNIRTENGFVGIISHVQILRDNISSKLIVEKNRETSSIEYSIG